MTIIGLYHYIERKINRQHIIKNCSYGLAIGAVDSLFFHDLQHHPGTQLEAVLENQAVCNDLIFPHTIGVFLKQLFLLVRHGGFEFFFVPADQLH